MFDPARFPYLRTAVPSNGTRWALPIIIARDAGVKSVIQDFRRTSGYNLTALLLDARTKERAVKGSRGPFDITQKGRELNRRCGGLRDVAMLGTEPFFHLDG